MWLVEYHGYAKGQIMHANHLMRKQYVCPRDQNCCAPTTLTLRLLLDIDVFLLIYSYWHPRSKRQFVSSGSTRVCDWNVTKETPHTTLGHQKLSSCNWKGLSGRGAGICNLLHVLGSWRAILPSLRPCSSPAWAECPSIRSSNKVSLRHNSITDIHRLAWHI